MGFYAFANHYKKIKWKQSKRLAGAHQFLSSRLSGLATRHLNGIIPNGYSLEINSFN